MPEIREAKEQELEALLTLYLHLHEDSVPDPKGPIRDVWERILKDPDHHVIVCEEGNQIVSSCVCLVIPNLTRQGRPYALIENVVTHPDYRGQGLGSLCLAWAREIARRENCYKIMLLTGSREEATHRFYQRAGYDNNEKTAYIQRLKP